jgi:hypothetical protein
MGASEWGKPPNALRAKGVEKEEEDILDVTEYTYITKVYRNYGRRKAFM